MHITPNTRSRRAPERAERFPMTSANRAQSKILAAMARKVAVLRRIVVLGVAALAIALASPSRAEDDAPRAVVDHLHTALIEVMKSGTALGFSGRYQNLDPEVVRAFSLPTMTRLAVGPTWTSFSDDQKARVTEAFHRFSVATYA